ncbi:hypothetical protein [Haloferula sp. A504]|uniref:hypothetical protein n=1 Tax=Haloferula sp. A504 TaxID=3373601 RepID=UPI0031C25734|nr:hypothetical protein [Verrucomicrobiaceae bacterium E54]
MTFLAKLRSWRWPILVLLCLMVAAVAAYRIAMRNFEVHVRVCTVFPRFANYMGMVPAEERSLDFFLQKDRFAVEKFTEAFSEPVQMSIHDNGGVLYLVRVWKAGSGYLVLTAGRDPRDFECFLRWEEDAPVSWGAFERRTEMSVLTREFLDDYEVIFIPIGPRGTTVVQTESSYTIIGRQMDRGAENPQAEPEKSAGDPSPSLQKADLPKSF